MDKSRKEELNMRRPKRKTRGHQTTTRPRKRTWSRDKHRRLPPAPEMSERADGERHHSVAATGGGVCRMA